LVEVDVLELSKVLRLNKKVHLELINSISKN